MEKWGEPGIFSHVKWRNQKMVKIWRTNRLHVMYSSTDYMLNALCVRWLPPTSYVRVVNYQVPWLFLLLWAQCVHARSTILSIPTSLTWEKITGPLLLYCLEAMESWAEPGYKATANLSYDQNCDTRSSPALPYWKQWKAGQSLGTRLLLTWVMTKTVITQTSSRLAALELCMKAKVINKLDLSATNFTTDTAWPHQSTSHFDTSLKCVLN